MADLRDIDLLYGHPGVPIYKTESRAWFFKRQPGINRQMRLLEPPLVIFSPSESYESNAGDATSRLRGRRNLLKHRPEFAPAAFLLPDWDTSADGGEGLLLRNAQTSEAIDAVTLMHEPLNSDLFAFGQINLDKNFNSHSGHSGLLATAGGLCGEILRLSLLNEEQINWKDSNGPLLFTETAVGAEQGFWIGHPSPIRQVTFTELSKNGEIWLAVRQDVIITIFQPILRKKPVYQGRTERTALPPSIVDANPVYRLDINSAGNASKAAFSDISFNPWEPLQVATIDQDGFWSIWNTDAQSMTATRNSLSHHVCGALYDDLKERGGKPADVEDRWARILWAGDSHTILVAGRRILQMFNLNTHPQRLEVPDLGLVDSEDWILDIKRSSADKSHVFVLTSSRLMWLQVSPLVENETMAPFQKAKLLVSWVHFRDSSDISLSLSLVEDIHEDEMTDEADIFTIMLYSKGNTLGSIFTFEYDKDTGHAWSRGDPYLIPSCSDGEAAQEGISQLFKPRRPHTTLSGLQMRPLRIQRTLSVQTDLKIDDEVKFYKCYRLGLNLKFFEQLCVAWPQNRSIAPVFLETFVRTRSLNTAPEPADDFIVPDEPSDGEVDDGLDTQDAWPTRSSPTTHTHVTHPSEIDFSWLANEVIGGRDNESRNLTKKYAELQPLERFLETLDNVKDSKLKATDSGIDLLHETQEQNTIALDVDLGAAALGTAIEDFNFIASLDDEGADLHKQEGSVAISSLPSTISRSIGLGEGVELDQIHDSLIATYLKPLSNEIPSRLRVATEKQLRFAATNFCLASHSIRLHPSDRYGGTTEQDNIQSSNRPSTLALRHRSPAALIKQEQPQSDSSPFSKSFSNDGNAQMPSSPISLNPSRKNSASHQSPSKMSRFSSSPPPSEAFSTQDTPAQTPNSYTQDLVVEDASIQRLRLLAPLSPQPVLPPNLSNILSHWAEGADPADYDWIATQQRIEAATMAASQDEEGRAGEDEQRRKKRKKSREKAPPSSQPSQLTQSQTQTQTLSTPWSPQPQSHTLSSPQRGTQIRLPSSSLLPTDPASQSQRISIPVRSSQGIDSSQPVSGHQIGGAKVKRLRGF